MKSLLLLALGLARTVVLGARIEAERIVVSVRPYKREQRRCPVCGRACDFYDMANRGAPRLWRAMDLARSACYLEYAPCRVRCPEHGVRTEAVPWARHGARFTRDFDDMMSGPDSVFKDCEIGKVWDENGSLFIHGYHHDGGVDVEVRQLTDAGEDALDVIEDAWYGEPFTVNDKEYDGSPESVHTAMGDLWNNPDLCPAPRYMELAFGCPAEEYEMQVAEAVIGEPVSLKAAVKESRAASEALAAHEAPVVDLEHEAENARAAAAALSKPDSDR